MKISRDKQVNYPEPNKPLTEALANEIEEGRVATGQETYMTLRTIIRLTKKDTRVRAAFGELSHPHKNQFDSAKRAAASPLLATVLEKYLI